MPDIVLATINAKWIHPSLALRLLKANLGALEPRCEILEFALRQPLSEKTGPILAARPRILGLSVSIWNHTATAELLDALDLAWADEGSPDQGSTVESTPRPLIVLGGPEASTLPENAALFHHADYVIRGEGEAAFRELCETALGSPSAPPDSLASHPDVPAAAPVPPLWSFGWAKTPSNLRSKLPGTTFIDAPQPGLGGIDPGYRLYTAEDLERKLTYVEASRGCPFGCEFCLSSVDRQVREFPLEKFLGEMENLIARGARSFKFLDRTFNLDMEKAARILEFFLRHLDPGMFVHFEMVPSRIPRELQELLARFPPGSLRIELGIQTFNPQTAALIGRVQSDPEKELETLDFLRRETNAIVHADLIAGLPGEDLGSFAQGFDRLWTARPGEIQLGILKFLPGTPIGRHTGPFGMHYSPTPPYEVMETAALPKVDLDRIKNFARFWELIVNRGAFPDLVSRLFPEKAPVFGPFMALSDRLLGRFGRNWGIDRGALRLALEESAGL
ncbi:radical SAM [Treponema primitia ZAS-2]|uniref:Radical SAM n=1 Tax=Treponema primitia (strain ATCC BAA-887 / DSM 12427 / ZAS-2) TaxID=545694 RepID=F5YIQ6_TREPZ|nr:B12-binding domain-containing radical SAM protein [Treponema primitia]AEF85938.1 radical SAM [Treponema primitia ZAS-2]